MREIKSMLAVLKSQVLSMNKGALSVGAPAPLRPEFVEYTPESEPQIQASKLPESIDAIIRAETANHLGSDRLAKTVADYPFSITSSNSPASYIISQSTQSTQPTILQESSIEPPKSFSTQSNYNTFLRQSALQPSISSTFIYSNSTELEFYSTTATLFYNYSATQPTTTYSQSTELFQESSYLANFTNKEIYRSQEQPSNFATELTQSQIYISTPTTLEIKSQPTIIYQPEALVSELTSTNPEVAIYAQIKAAPLPQISSFEPTKFITSQLLSTTYQPEIKTDQPSKLEPSNYQLNLENKIQPTIETTQSTIQITENIHLQNSTINTTQSETTTYNPTNIFASNISTQPISKQSDTSLSTFQIFTSTDLPSQLSTTTSTNDYFSQQTTTESTTSTIYTTLESALDTQETKISQNFQPLKSNLQSLESAFDPLLSNLKQTNNSLYKVHENGDNYRRDLPEIIVTQEHLDAIKNYKVITKDGKEIDISNSVLALVHMHYKALGIEVTIDSQTSSIFGQTDQGVAIEVKDLQTVAHEFSLSDSINIGTIVEVNGEEPEKGTVPLNRYSIKLGDRVQIAAVAQGLYHKISQKNSTIDHISTTGEKRSEYSASDDCAPADYKKEGGFSPDDTCVPGGVIIKNSNDSAVHLADQVQINADSEKRYILEKRDYDTNNWTMNVEKNGKPEIVQTDFKDHLTLDEHFEILAETKNIHVKRKMVNGQVSYTGVYGFDHLPGEFQVMVYRKDGSSIIANNDSQLKINNGDMVTPMYVGKNQ